jgi:hypothetical protein
MYSAVCKNLMLGNKQAMLQKKPWPEPELERRGPEKRPSVRRREWIDWGAPLACCCGVDDASVARPRRLFRARRVTSFTAARLVVFIWKATTTQAWRPRRLFRARRATSFTAARLVVFIWKATTTQAWRGHGDCSVHGAPLHGRMVILNQTQRKLLPVDHNGLNDGQHHRKKRKWQHF